MKATVPNSIRKTAKTAATSDTRETLNQVKITNTQVIAIDGFVLVIRNFDKPNGLQPGEELLVPASLLSNPIFNLKKGTEDSLTIEEKRTSWGYRESLAITKGNTSLVCKPLQCDSFPSTDFLMKDALSRKEMTRISFTIELLKKLLNSIDDSDSITFRLCKPNEPIMFRAGNSEGIIMPRYEHNLGDIWPKSTDKSDQNK
jgi:DNA polymerase III sliding clamp (beta) subunit (PCNA family)